jgi:hypothetical protein
MNSSKSVERAAPQVPGAPKGYDRYEAQQDLHHMTEARKIQGDPKRLAHVQHAAKEKMREQHDVAHIAAGMPAPGAAAPAPKGLTPKPAK